MNETVPDHTLCGYLCTVLTVPPQSIATTIPFSAPCHLTTDDNDNICFQCQNGIVLYAIRNHVVTNSDNAGNSRKRGRGKIGMVKGSISVVHRIHALVVHKCVKIQARVLKVEENGEEARAVLLVEVYLPVDFCSGWQFPRSGSVAGSLFRHLSCDWKERNLMLNNGIEISKDGHGNVRSIWSISDCHVLGCKLHCDGVDLLNERLFELHDIFKSLPSLTTKGMAHSSRVQPADNTHISGIWDIADDILINILAALGPMDLTRVAATCRHLRSLAALIMPCMKLKLFPHQQAAVEWMLRRERNAEVLCHPLYMEFSTEDGIPFYVNSVSGSIVIGTAPTIRDFRGGMFCDEPGLGKTITALSLILKTQGTLADPPEGVQIIWCTHNGNDKCGYYELRGDGFPSNNMTLGKRTTSQNGLRVQSSLGKFCLMEDINHPLPKRARLMDPGKRSAEFNDSCSSRGIKSPSASYSEPLTWAVRSTRNLSHIRKNLLYGYDGLSGSCKGKAVEKNAPIRNGLRHVYWGKQVNLSYGVFDGCMRPGKGTACNETWVQCDACHKWRKLADSSIADAKVAWFCSMNTDPAHQSCTDPEEAWDNHQSITYLPGFFTKGTAGGKEENVSFFISVLKEHYALINSKTKKALLWLAKLSPVRLSEMETVGLSSPILGTGVAGDALGFHKIFQALGLIKRVEKGISRWYYPQTLENLAFDLAALRIALCEPLDSVRLYLSRATLVVVPSNLVDHWKTQIQKHVRPGQLQLYVWTDHRKPLVHSLAWDYDIVITTFNRLSAEWGPRKRSVLMQVHWLRVILDEGHTLGSSLNLTNKLQMAISLTASNRWLLTGTPTPNTPNSQLSHLQPLLKFLHEEAYGQNQKSWEAGILKPFEAKMEEGRSRLLQLLHRCMISARKIDLRTIPPCIKKVTFVNFTDEHARSYNELVVTVRRNILMADWNDPSHVESLLNPKQWKFRSTTIRNVRLSCCVAGHIKVTDAGEDIQETMDILVENGLDQISEEYDFIKYNLLYGGNCQRCNEWCRLPVVTPCRHLLCLDCVALDCKMCTLPGCGNLYEMQTPETLARPENPNPKWPVPKDLIELQPSYKQDDWNPDWQSTSSSKVAYLVERLKALREVNKEIHCFRNEDSDAKLVDKLLWPSRRGDMDVPLLQNCSILDNKSYKTLPEKVLIFSQFLEHIHVIEQQLTFAGIKFAGMYTPMHSSKKMKSLAMFQYDDSCMALLMDGSAALGLDLSFVTHVFLMEPIWDRSMEEQVISRAHRMGATRPIHVETLAMRATIEEQMLEFLQDADACRKFLKEESQKPDREGSRTCRTLHDFAESNYLARLSFVRRNSVS
ncbi:F-box protein At3g54460-like isoform X1 [Durio zibethinus]|uniref:F-box protein At3g54460-like isoform X1 n=1 Tax=Durio zibethinus TaxID=66656 RepID=A0A6P5Z0I3_DURZI|nr:F-box protein At3g54460-like isoform X1 [Durio zibethinus]XP_022745852.1 F-box protein At3g54460-like isoform X1 [Durio zibethinus]XP_022745853.1 F-box protein At3g54460-like isoform X1 [Durio zibethinus]